MIHDRDDDSPDANSHDGYRPDGPVQNNQPVSAPLPKGDCPIAPPEQMTHSVKPAMAAIALADQAATELINQVNPPASSVVPNLPTHVANAKRHAQTWQQTLRPQVIQVLGGVVAFGNTFEHMYTPLLQEAQRIANGDTTANASFQTHIAGLHNTTSRTATTAKALTPQLKQYAIEAAGDSANLLGDSNTVTAQLAGDKAAINTLNDTLHSREKDLKTKIIITAFFPLIMGIVEGIKHDIRDAKRALHDAQQSLDDTAQEAATLRALQLGLASFVRSAHTLQISMSALADGWDNLNAQFNELMQSENITASGLWTPALLDTARRNWVDLRDLAITLGEGIHQWPVDNASLLRYKKLTGTAILSRITVTRDAGQESLKLVDGYTSNGWRRDWSLLCRGDFMGRKQAQIALYDPVHGDIDIVGFDAAGSTMKFDYQNQGLPKQWEAMVAGDFLGNSCSQLMLYDPTAGTLTLASFDHNGKLARQVAYADGGTKANNQQWDTLVAGRFLPNGRSQLLTYAVNEKRMTLTGFQQQGRIELQKTTDQAIPQASWRLMEVGDFLGVGQDQIIFHSQQLRQICLVSFTTQGQPVVHATQSLAADWQLATVGDFLGNGRAQIACYDSQSGAITLLSFTDHGGIAISQTTTIRQGWNQMVVGQVLGNGLDQILAYGSEQGIASIIRFKHTNLAEAMSLAHHWDTDWTTMCLGHFCDPRSA